MSGSMNNFVVVNGGEVVVDVNSIFTLRVEVRNKEKLLDEIEI